VRACGSNQFVDELVADGFELVEHVQGTKVLKRLDVDRDSHVMVDRRDQ
jgi:hypothetical protein